MVDLADVIYQGPTVTWAKAKVVSVESDGTLTVSMNNGSVPHVKILESYTSPAAGDLANLLIFEPVGMIALGKSKPVTLPTPPVPGTPATVTKTDVGTWDITAQTWNAIPTLTNLFTRPSFEDNITTSFTPTGCTLSVQNASTQAVLNRSGTRVLRMSATVAGGAMDVAMANAIKVPITVGRQYRVTAYTRAPIALPATATVQLTAEFRDASNVLVAGSSIASAATAFVATDWQRKNVLTIAAPANAVTLTFNLKVAGTGLVVGSLVDWDAIMVNDVTADPTAALLEFFDGDTPDASDIDYSWTGTARASSSTANARSTLLLKKGFRTAIIYPQSSFLPFKDKAVETFQIEMQAVSVPSTPVFVLHGNQSADDDSKPFVVLSDEFAANGDVPTDASVWIDLPTSWGEAIASGSAFGVGLATQNWPMPDATFTPASGSLRYVLLT